MIEKVTGWFLDLVIKVFTAIWDFFSDIAIAVLDGILSAIAALVSAIPAPSFLTSYSLSTLMGGLPSDVLYFVHALNLPQCFAILAAGFAFRMTRKILTLGQW